MAEKGLFEKVYTPDVLSCLANLSSDEVFTPPELANDMLDALPQELFKNPNSKFLEPACKSGVFLREIAKRLLEGQLPGYKKQLEEIQIKKNNNIELSNCDKSFLDQLQNTIDHIFHNQLYGIAITELTSLLSRRSVYCSKYANGSYSVTKFDNADGNIKFRNIQHSWKDGKCVFCGTSRKSVLGKETRSEDLETHAYEFIHTLKPMEIFNMKFDVIIGNPPYQLSDGGNGASASPIYQLFIEQAKKLNPNYLSMIIPARWYAGGKGLDEFRKTMLEDKHIVKLVDYVNAKDCFPGTSIGGGVCYFLWDRNHTQECEYTNIHDGKAVTASRDLSEYSVFVRYNEAISIIKKVAQFKEPSVSEVVGTRNPFGFASSARGTDKGECTLFSSAGTGKVSRDEIHQGKENIDKYKVMISKVTSEHAGEPDKSGKFNVVSTTKVLNPKEVCTDSYLLAYVSNNENEAVNFAKYICTKFFRFLLLQAVSSINLSKDKFAFIPMQNFSKEWTDAELYAKYGLSDDEIFFIDSMMKEKQLGGE